MSESGPPEVGAALDAEAIGRLRRLGGDELTGRMAGLLLELAPRRLEAAWRALDGGDRDGARRAAHSLKSSAGNVGAYAVMVAAGGLEEESERGSPLETLVALLGAADAAWEAARPELEILARRGKGNPRVKTIAYVEENADNRLLLKAILEDGYEVVEYETGPDALAGLRRRKPDLVILDISLPAMDGIEVLRRIRADPALVGLPVMALTAHAMAGDRERLLAAGFDGYVAKPIVDEGILLGAIQRLVP